MTEIGAMHFFSIK